MGNNVFEETSNLASMVDAMDQEASAGKVQSPYWSPKGEGITPIRFLPQLKTFKEKLFYQKMRVHYIGGRPYLCLNQTLTDKDGNVHEACNCPFCKKSKQLYNNSERDTPEWKLAGELRAKDRFVSRVIVRGNKNNKGENIEWKPEFYEFGTKIHEMIYNTMKLGECGDVLSLKEGRDFNLSKKGVKKNTDYSGSTFSMKVTPIFQDEAKLRSLLEEIPKLDYKQLVEFQSYDSLDKVLKEYLSEESEDESVDTKDPITSDDTFGVKKEEPKASDDSKADESTGDVDLDALINGI